MRRMNFREAQDLIDFVIVDNVECEVASCGYSVENRVGTAWLTLRFRMPRKPTDYRSSGPVEFDPTQNDTLRIVAINPRECRLSNAHGVQSVWFSEGSQPLLARYEPRGEVICNSSFDVAKVREAVLSRLGNEWRDEVERCLPQVPSWGQGWKWPCSLGGVVRPVYVVLVEELRRVGARLYLASESLEARELPVVMRFDDGNFIIADDFEVELPELEWVPEGVG